MPIKYYFVLSIIITFSTSAFSSTQCFDGIDNDGDGYIDYITDPGCSSHSDNDERGTSNRSLKAGLPKCADGDDNDEDGVWDHPNDAGCGSYGDNSEYSEPCQAGDRCMCGLDRNQDGIIDSRNEFTSCNTWSGRLICSKNLRECVQRYFSVWNPSGNRGIGLIEQRQDWVCPDGEEFSCGVNPDDGKRYCSVLPCVNVDTNFKRHESRKTWPEDSPEPDGSCKAGNLQIFSGTAKRCRKSGASTLYQNCCSNDLPPLSDRMGSPGEINQREYRKQNTKFEFWKNQCDLEDQETSLLVDSNYCIYIGTYCSKKILGIGCVQKNKSYCCYNSYLAALIHNQMKNLSEFGKVKNPDCKGFTPEEFQSLDFSKIDFSSYLSSIRKKSQSQIQTDTQINVPNNLGN